METIPSKPAKSVRRKIIETTLKILITVICFWYVSTKIDFSRAWHALVKADWWLLFIALLFYTLSKIISSYRLNINFRNIQLRLSEWENLKLYWLGMFYNLFLPGAISGDAYKVIILNKTHQAPYKKTSIAVLLDRFSGLLGIGVLMSLYSILVIDNILFNLIMVAGAVLSTAILYLSLRAFFKDFLPGFAATFLLGIVVQVSQVICVYFILKSLQIPLSQLEWILIFLASSVISVLPISLGGGLGTREVVFAEGARIFHLSPEMGIVISLLFYLNNLICSFWGLYFVFNAPIKKPPGKAA